MIQLQALNNILTNNNLAEYIEGGVREKHFFDYKEEYNFILHHYNQYDKVPDITTFMMKFTEFEVIDVLEPTRYLIYNLIEDYNYEQCVKIGCMFAEKAEKNSFDALKYIAEKAETLLENQPSNGKTNINDMVEEKIEDIDKKRATEGLLGISSGFKELDDILMGWQAGQELVTIVGRVNQGKSWILLKFLAEAHRQGKSVLLYSGEMSKSSVAYRIDTLQMNYSNRQLTFGTISDNDYDKYKTDIAKNNKNLPEFHVYTPKDLGGKLLDVPTLRHLIKKHNPDIIGVDQLSLMEDFRHAREKRLQLSNITIDLFNLSEEFGKPILADAQANRNKSDMENPEVPELADLSESDAIGQNSSRVIGLVQTKSGLKLKITKNRYGQNNKTLTYVWDIDVGTFRYIAEEVKDNDEYVPNQQVNDKPLQPRNAGRSRRLKEDLF